VACERSILPSTSSSVYLFYSYLDEIHRITAKKYIPTDGMWNVDFPIQKLMFHSRRTQGTPQDDGCR